MAAYPESRRPVLDADTLHDGEAIHRSVIDRMNLPECRYDPANVFRFNPNIPPSKEESS